MTAVPDRFAEAERIVAHDAPHAFEAVVPAIVQTSLFTFATTADMVETYAGRKSRPVYSRTTNPTVTLFEEKLAALEGADDAIGFPSGMAAISGAVLAFVEPGDRIVCVRHVYPDAYRLFETLLKKLRVSVDYVDGTDPGAIAAALPGAQLLYLESPTSWTMEALDVGALAGLARRHGVMTMIDNSWATPVFQKPVVARGRPRDPLGLEIYRRPQRHGGGRRGGSGRPHRPYPPARSAPISGPSSRLSRPGCCCAGCGPCRSG